MTVNQLIHELSKYPGSMDVFVAPRVTDFTYGLANSVRSEEITFSEDDAYIDLDGPKAKDTVVIIDEQ